MTKPRYLHLRNLRLFVNAGIEFPTCAAQQKILDMDRATWETTADKAKVSCPRCLKLAGQTWEVVVGNVGTVYRGDDAVEAKTTFAEYRRQSILGYGRVGLETVTLFCDDEPVEVHAGQGETV